MLYLQHLTDVVRDVPKDTSFPSLVPPVLAGTGALAFHPDSAGTAYHHPQEKSLSSCGQSFPPCPLSSLWHKLDLKLDQTKTQPHFFPQELWSHVWPSTSNPQIWTSFPFLTGVLRHSLAVTWVRCSDQHPSIIWHHYG